MQTSSMAGNLQLQAQLAVDVKSFTDNTDLKVFCCKLKRKNCIAVLCYPFPHGALVHADCMLSPRACGVLQPACPSGWSSRSPRLKCNIQA